MAQYRVLRVSWQSGPANALVEYCRLTKTLADWTAQAKELAEMTRNGLAELQSQRHNQK
jgi:hypothetical protein